MGDTTNQDVVLEKKEVSKESKKETAPKKKSFFKGLKREFKKIVWPDKKTVGKQTIAVLTAAITLGIVIGVVDFVIQYGLSLIL